MSSGPARLVTVGLPTYDRADLLPRALDCLARQDYPNFEVIVSDNASPGPDTEAVVESYRSRIANLRYVRQERNIGALPNFFAVLGEARGEYFMWLADDDEISDGYISELAALLDANPDASTATGKWRLMTSPTQGRDMPTSSFPQGRAFSRLWRYVWHTDDAFYYGLHRTESLRRATTKPFWWPNRKRIRNWAYPYLMDIVIDGKLLVASEAVFVNHDYTLKLYQPRGGIFADLARGFVRRVNVHAFYLEKIGRRVGPWAALAIAPVSAAALIAEGVRAGLWMAGLVWKRLRPASSPPSCPS